MIKPIETEPDHAAALRPIERLWGAAAVGDRLEFLTTRVEAYEQAHFPNDTPDSREATYIR
jgi:HTH-type transcriptional regulator/antitoxin HigA